MNPQEFYDGVAEIFDETHEYIQPASGNTKKRWGPRGPGNGRFTGRGIVRFFSPTVIHVALTKPMLHGTLDSADDALMVIGVAEEMRVWSAVHKR